MKKKKKCECMACAHGMDAVKEHEAACMAAIGWYAHIVEDDDQSPSGFNFHTHGLDVTFKQPDLQIVYPMEPERAHDVVHTIIEKIRKGNEFRPGKDYSGIIKKYKICFAWAIENNRRILRVIIPGRDGILNRIFMEEPFVKQYERTI